MRSRTRLAPEQRRAQLVATAARAFASRPYHEVRMEEIAITADVSRGLLYQYFPTKPELFAAVYRQAAAELLDQSRIDPEGNLAEQIAAGLDAHLEYFDANRHTVITANRTLAGNRVIQTIIDSELAALRDRLVGAAQHNGYSRELAAAGVLAWLTFVRTLCVESLIAGPMPRAEVRQMCLDTLQAALGPATAYEGRDTSDAPAR